MLSQSKDSQQQLRPDTFHQDVPKVAMQASKHPYEINTMIIPILQMRRLKPTVTQLACGGSEPGCLTSEPGLLTSMSITSVSSDCSISRLHAESGIRGNLWELC